jgi:hypothetical protein
VLAELSEEMKRRTITTPSGIESMIQKLKKAAATAAAAAATAETNNTTN